MFKFYLDGNLVSDPLNWSDFSETIERDEAIKGLLPKYEIKLNFSGGGYEYLYNSLQANGFCKLVQLRVDFKCGADYETVLNGYIFLSDCVFNLNKYLVECDVIDNNFGARIYNNKNLKAKIDTGYSKNGIVIAPATETNFGIYSTTNTLIGTRKLFHIKDVFRFLIEFMSDGQIGFESNYLTPGVLGETAGWIYIAQGQELRLNDGSVPVISFQEVFEEVNKKYPISFTTTVDVNGKPIIKIENDSFFYNASNSISISNIQDLKQSFNKELLYAKIKLGNPAAEYDALLGSFPIIRFLSFSEEEYQLQGECNIDKTLDLTGSFVSDSNIIERLTATDTGNDQYDANVVFVESTYGAGSNLSNSPTTDTNPFYYNANLTNNNVSERYALANNIAFYLGNNSEAFMATKTAPQNYNAGTFDYYSPATIFEDDSTSPNFDPTNAYNPTNGRYTSAADGVYGFEAQLFFYIEAAVLDTSFTYAVAFRVYDSSNVLKATFLGDSVTNNLSAGIYSVSGNRSINVISGYYVTANLYMNVSYGSGLLISLYGYATSYFKTTAVENGGGIYEYKEPDNYIVSKFEFQQPLSNNSYNTMKQDLSKAILFNNGYTPNKKGWIRKLTRNYATGQTDWELISNLTNSN